MCSSSRAGGPVDFHRVPVAVSTYGVRGGKTLIAATETSEYNYPCHHCRPRGTRLSAGHSVAPAPQCTHPRGEGEPPSGASWLMMPRGVRRSDNCCC